MNIDTGTVLHKPKKLEGGKNIFIGKNSFIGKDSWLATFNNYHGVQYKPIIQIEDQVSIGSYACITSINKIVIKKGTLISEFFYVSDHTHGFDPESILIPANQNLFSKGPVEIGERCFVGYRVSVMPGVKIGNGCVIGNNSVVTKNIPDYCMVVGSPARIIKKYNFLLKKWDSI